MKNKPFLTKDLRAELKKSFQHLSEDVPVAVITKAGLNDLYNQTATQLLHEFAEVDARIKVTEHDISSELAQKLGIDRSPVILIGHDRYDIRLVGAPLGEEGRTLVAALIIASTGMALMQEDSIEQLETLTERRHVKVFVSPT